jgi:hypothetical protein
MGSRSGSGWRRLAAKPWGALIQALGDATQVREVAAEALVGLGARRARAHPSTGA